MPSKSLKKLFRGSRPTSETSDNHPSANTITFVSDLAWEIGASEDFAMSAIRTSLAVLQEGSSLAAKLPFIAPIAGLILQALTMRDEVKQYKEECEIVMHKLARIARIVVDLCEKYNLSEEDLPASLRAILDSLQKELDSIGQVLKMCSRKKGIEMFFLRNDLLTKIKQCDVELSNVLQAFQAELLLDVRVALMRPETPDSVLLEATPTTPKDSNCAQTFWGTNSIFWHTKLNAKEPIIRLSQADLLSNIRRLSKGNHVVQYTLPPLFFFLIPDQPFAECSGDNEATRGEAHAMRS